MNRCNAFVLAHDKYSAVPLLHTSLKQRFEYDMFMLWRLDFTTLEFYKGTKGNETVISFPLIPLYNCPFIT